MLKNNVGAEDLLSDDSFLSWYFKTDPRHVQQWEQWIAANPGGGDQAARAIELLNSLRLRERTISPDTITLAESRLLQKIHQFEKRKGTRTIARVVPFSAKRWWVAAAVILLAGALYGAHLWRSRDPEFRTGYGEVRGRRLPDGTDVMVNADSRIVYNAGWQDGKDREVWLNGEAFFHVSRTPLKSRFIVHTDHFDIIVTGTQFNVVNRNDKDNIMLKEGSVILHTDEGKELKMSPGDFVEYNSAQLEKKLVKKDSVLAWKEYKLVFDNTPLKELVRIIREHYGITVKLAHESIGDKTISGILPNDNLDVLLQALEATQEFKVIRQGDAITIGDHS
jgi:ferric-dicitrate binding protein FerR (iron transport regulator)